MCGNDECRKWSEEIYRLSKSKTKSHQLLNWMGSTEFVNPARMKIGIAIDNSSCDSTSKA